MQRTIKVEVVSNSETDLLLMVSEDMPGLMVHGRSMTELRERAPIAIKALLEAEGLKVEDVHEVRGLRDESTFRPMRGEFAAGVMAA